MQINEKKILGLRFDHETINTAILTEDTKTGRKKIENVSTRKVSLTKDEKDKLVLQKKNTNTSTASARRSARKNNFRRLLRKRQLVQLLHEHGFISDDTPMDDTSAGQTRRTWEMRAAAVERPIPLDDLARVFLHMNRHRGYRGTIGKRDDTAGKIIKGMDTAVLLHETGMTPGQLIVKMKEEGDNRKPEFYPSDLRRELVAIINAQKEMHPELIDDNTAAIILSSSPTELNKAFAAKGIKPEKRTGQIDMYRAAAAEGKELDASVLASVITDIARQADEGSKLLGQISDRNKQTIIEGLTPGQWHWRQMKDNPGMYSTKEKPFFRFNIKDEFDKIWETQAPHHPEMTPGLRETIRDKVIFYQRDLKSKKGGWCPFESFMMNIDGQAVHGGCRTAPKSSPLFQEFRMYADIHNIKVTERETGIKITPDAGQMSRLAEMLRLKKTMTQDSVMKALGFDKKRYELNFCELKGNQTLAAFSSAIESVAKSRKLKSAEALLEKTGACTGLLDYDWSLGKEEYERQPLVRLWQLIDDYCSDDSEDGMETLRMRIREKFGTDEETSAELAMVSLPQGHASLSHKAMKKLLTHMKEGTRYEDACIAEGYSMTETRGKEQGGFIPHIKKGELMNPITEKMINQMINVINALVERYGRLDEIHVELPRLLQMSQKAKRNALETNRKNQARNARYREEIIKLTGQPKVTANQLLRYTLYQELKENGYRTLYSNRKIEPHMLFEKNTIHKEHILPQSVYFMDNQSNMTLEFEDVDFDKKDTTARDYVLSRYGQKGLEEYLARVENLYQKKAISKAKYNYLRMPLDQVPNNVLDKALPSKQYAMKELAKLLALVADKVVYTCPEVTRRLKNEWGLTEIITDINAENYLPTGRVKYSVDEYGRKHHSIEGWTPARDPRAGTIDAVVIAMTTPSHIQYLNNLAAAKIKDSTYWKLRNSLTVQVDGKRMFVPPIPLQDMRDRISDLVRNCFVSSKTDGKLISTKHSRHKVKDHETGKYRTVKDSKKTFIPRGELHDESVYRKIEIPTSEVLRIGVTATRERLMTVTSPEIRNALLKRLDEYGGDPKAAFTGKNRLSQKPVWLDEHQIRCVPQTVECTVPTPAYIMRKTLDQNINFETICSKEVKDEIMRRAGTPDRIPEVLAHLKEHPITVNGQQVKKVRVLDKSKRVPLRFKKGPDGKTIRDEHGNPIPTDYVKTNSNHHVTVYKDQNGKLHARIMSLYETVNLYMEGKDPYDRGYNSEQGWQYVMHLCKNEAVLMPDMACGFIPDEMTEQELNDSPMTTARLFRLQKSSDMCYVFRHHADNSAAMESDTKNVTWLSISSAEGLRHAVKVRIAHDGRLKLQKD